jgi:hypothetical protein
MKLYIHLFLFILFSLNLFAQTGVEEINVVVQSGFEAKIKDAVRQSDLPSISDTIKKIKIKEITILPKIIHTTYSAPPIAQAKLMNEPLSKLYYSYLKIGAGNYNSPLAEFYINNLRSKDYVYGLHFKHFSARYTTEGLGFSAFSDNELKTYVKKYYKKYTLSADFNYNRNVNHFYGYPDSLTKKFDESLAFRKQLFNTLEGKLNLKSYYTDSNKINHDIKLNYYNITDNFSSSENNIYAEGFLNTYVNKEKLNALVAVDYYNTKSVRDTTNNLIVRLNPYFEAGGKKWKVDVGLNLAADKFSDTTTKFYFSPKLNIHYDIYNNFFIPYAGLNGGLQKNSFRGFVTANPFIYSSQKYLNTFNLITVHTGIRGILSSKTSYDTKISYGTYKNMHFFLINYDDYFNNKFKVVYDDVDLLQVTGELKYQLKEKINVIARGNYYNYKLSSNSKAWHRPDFDINLAGTYNLKDKIIAKLDLFYIGKQWALQREWKDGKSIDKAIQLDGFADINIGFEYRYSKMLSFFTNFNNIGNVRYYRWDRYPTQRFNAMIGVTFIPF